MNGLSCATTNKLTGITFSERILEIGIHEIMIRFGGCKRPLSTKVWSVAKKGENINQLKQETIELKEKKITIKVNAISINPIDQWILNGRLETIQNLKYKLKEIF